MEKKYFESYAKAMLTAYNEVKIIWGQVLEVSKQMDGKVINKRFIDAINAKCEGIGRVYMDGSKNLEIYLLNRSFEDKGKGWVYFDKRLYYTYSHGVDFSGRVDAEKVAVMYSSLIEGIDDKMQEWQDAAKNFDKYEKKMRKALGELNKALGGVNRIFKPYQLSSYEWEHFDSYRLKFRD